MSNYTPLTLVQKTKLVNDFVNLRLLKTQNVEHPKIVLVGAQPGAGKSNAAKLVKSELRQEGGYIHVDADIMRAVIPVPEGVVYSSAQTQSDAGGLAGAVRQKARENKRNIIEEGTFRNAPGISSFIESGKAAGYAVELLAVATAPEESIAGIFKRYEEQHAGGVSQPRFVDEGYHNEALMGFKNTLAQCENQFDRIRVTNRENEILYDSLNPQQNQHKSAKEALESFQNLSPERLKEVAKSWDEIQTQAERRTQDPVEGYFEKVHQHREAINERLEQIYTQERVVVNSQGATLQRKSEDGTYQDVEKVAVSKMKAAIHILGSAKPAEDGKTYEGEIVHKDAASVFQKTSQGLIRHKNIQKSGKNIISLGKRVNVGQNVSIHRADKQLVLTAASLNTQRGLKR